MYIGNTASDQMCICTTKDDSVFSVTNVIQIVADVAIWLQCPQIQPEYLIDLKNDKFWMMYVFFFYMTLSKCQDVVLLQWWPQSQPPE